MNRLRFNSFNSVWATFLLAAAVFTLGSGVARAVDHATIELQLIWGSNEAESPDPSQKPVEPAVERLLATSPYRWKHYYLVNKRVEDIQSDRSKDKISMSSHSDMDIKYLGGRRVQVKLYGDGKLLSTHREALPLLLAGDAQNDTAWLVLIQMATPKSAASPVLVTPDEAQIIEDKFHSDYAKMGNPRILIYVNRDLVDTQSGLRLSARTERVETTRTTGASSNDTTTTRSVANNTYSQGTGGAPTLADRQTVRDLERLMGGPFRAAGATLVDQGVATQLIGDRSLDSLTLDNSQARRDREAVSKIADVALEVLVSSRKVTVAEVAGDKTYNIPDIQATAIRLSDARVIGQASSADVMNKAGGPGFTARNFGVEAITQATALSLLDDMAAEAK